MADVIAGMHYAFARRISYLVPVSDNIVLIGGAVKNRGIVAALSEIIGTQVEVRVPEEPQIINALGASLYGAEL
jgi:activator of 2-hydroxyglutaryl-CoA dehydratase